MSRRGQTALTADEHVEIGAACFAEAERLRALHTLVANRYPVAHRAVKAVEQAITAHGRMRARLDDLLYDENPGAAYPSPYYGAKP